MKKITRTGASAVILAACLLGLATAANAAFAGSSDPKTGSLQDNPPPEFVQPNAPGSVTRQFHIDSSLPIEEQVAQAMAGGGLNEVQARELVAMDPANAGK